MTPSYTRVMVSAVVLSRLLLVTVPKSRESWRPLLRTSQGAEAASPGLRLMLPGATRASSLGSWSRSSTRSWLPSGTVSTTS